MNKKEKRKKEKTGWKNTTSDYLSLNLTSYWFIWLEVKKTAIPITKNTEQIKMGSGISIRYKRGCSKFLKGKCKFKKLVNLN